ncbi:hypothetical protein [Streptomyces sp. NPDC018947]|uniref:hypothetical protein n=1 Tax=Streptomyces sp. NPDC018947 TaxID=3365054 RepID=UPI00379918D9
MTGTAAPGAEHGRAAGKPADGDGGRRYDVFVSYSQNLDRDVATVFQRGMENFGRPWYRPTRLRVFRDMTHLSASHDLQGDIEDALARSSWLVVMASPLAAASPWVRAEIDWWVANKRVERMLLAWTDGHLEWSPAERNFDWSRTDALPREQMERALAAAPGAPRWVDLRWLRAQIDERGSVPPNDPRLLADVAEFVAPIQGRSKAELIGHHLRLRKRRNRLVAATVVVLGALLAAATGLGLAADRQRDVATERRLAATSRQLVAEATSIQYARPDLARQLLVEAYRLAHTEQAVGALLGSASIPRVLRTDGASRAVAFSPRGRLLAAASVGGVTLFDGATGSVVSTLRGQGNTAALAFSADGGLLAAGDSEGHVRLWDVSDAREPGPAGSARPVADVKELSFAGTSSLLAVGNGLRVVVLDTRDRGRPEVTDYSSAFDSALGFGADTSPDGKLIATGAGDDRVRIMGLSPTGRLSTVSTLDTPSSAVVFSPSGHLLATSGEDGTARLWDIADPRRPVPRATLNGANSSRTLVAFTEDGKTLAVGTGDGAVQLWDISDPVRPLQGDRLSGHTGTVSSLAFDPDGRTLASVGLGDASTPAEAHRAKGVVRLWNVHGSRSSSAYASVPAGQLSSQPFGPGGRILVTGRPGALYRLGTGQEPPRRLATLPSFRSGGQTYSFSPDGRTLATGHPSVLWDVSDPAHPRERGRVEEVQDPHGTVYEPGGAVLAAAEPLSPVRLWEVSDPDRPRDLGTLPGSGPGPGPYWGTAPAAFAADRGLVAVTGEDGTTVHLWDLGRDGRRYDPVRTDVIALEDARVGALTTSPDGNTLYVGDSQGTLTVWDITDPHRPRARGASQRHASQVTHLAADPARPLLASADHHGAVRLWDVGKASAPREVALLATNERYSTTGVAFSPDGGLIAVSTYDSTQLWRTDLDAVLGRLCAESVPLTESEWKQYLPDHAYDPPCA